MILIPIEKIFSNRDSIRKAREAFLIQKKKKNVQNNSTNVPLLKRSNKNNTEGWGGYVANFNVTKRGPLKMLNEPSMGSIMF